MYQNIFISQRTETEPSTVYVWDDTDGLVQFPWSHFNYAYRVDPKGDYLSIYGERLKKIRRFDRDEPGLYESDLARETRVLSDMYLDSDMPSTGHRIGILDIEVSSEGGFAKVDDADKEVTAITIYHQQNDAYYVFLLDKDNRIQSREEGNITLLSCQTEIELLESFMTLYVALQFTIITGWNVDGYDIPYLHNRLRRVFGNDMARALSPIGLIKYNQNRERFQIAGVSVLDYLTLYKKFTFGQKPSYRLDAIAKAEVGVGKVEYEGSLDDLYRYDINKFIEYNIHDVRLVDMIDKKMKLIELARFICHIGHVPYEDFSYSSKFIEGTIITYLHRKGIICSNKPEGGREAFQTKMDDDSEGFSGAFVRAPYPGLYEWVYSLDLQSLYPSIIMSLNISPDTKMGRVFNWDVEKHMRGEIETYEWETEEHGRLSMTRNAFVSFLKNNNFSISSNGILYTTEKVGVIPEILDKWFAERVEYKNLMKKYIKEGNQEQADFYDRRQHVQKILLNSIYGVLGLPIFRFYDLDNALAVTATGQDVIKTTAKYLNNHYKKMGAEPRSQEWVRRYWDILRTEAKKRKEPMPPAPSAEDWNVYIDTDSVYFEASPLFEKYDGEDAKAKTIQIAKEMEAKVNKFYDSMAKALFNCDSHRFVIKGESVMETGLWVAKKRYAMKKVFDLETDKDMDGKLKVTGLDVVRSSFPPAFAKFMSDVLMAILNKTPRPDIDKMILDFRAALDEKHYLEVARNTSIKGLSIYDDPTEESLTRFTKGAPAHVKAAITYNRLIRKLGKAGQYAEIRDGDKIKWAYLRTNPYGIETVAIKTYDDPPEIEDLMSKYLDYDALFEKELEKKLVDFYGSLNWGRLPTQMNQAVLQFFTFE